MPIVYFSNKTCDEINFFLHFITYLFVSKTKLYISHKLIDTRYILLMTLFFFSLLVSGSAIFRRWRLQSSVGLRREVSPHRRGPGNKFPTRLMAPDLRCASRALRTGKLGPASVVTGYLTGDSRSLPVAGVATSATGHRRHLVHYVALSTQRLLVGRGHANVFRAGSPNRQSRRQILVRFLKICYFCLVNVVPILQPFKCILLIRTKTQIHLSTIISFTVRNILEMAL